MAEKAIEKINEQLNCSICLDTYTDPKQLQCNHVFCQKCLVKLVIRDQLGQHSLSCPTCRKSTPVPAAGTTGLQSAFHISNLLEVRGVFKDLPLAAKPVASSRSCPEHSGELKLFCETCQELICIQCAVKGGEHFGHEYDSLNKVYEKCKGEIVASLEPMEEKLTVVNEIMAQYDQHFQEISKQQATIESEIHDTMKQPCDILRAREAELIDELHQMAQDKLKPLSAQRELVETTQVQLKTYLGVLKENLKTGDKLEFLKIKPILSQQVQELHKVAIFPPDTSMPSLAGTYFISSSDSLSLCRAFWLLSATTRSPTKWHAIGEALEAGVEGCTASFTLQALGIKGKSSQEVLSSVKYELKSEMKGFSSTCRLLQQEGNFIYRGVCTSNQKGRLQLHITFNGQHIAESPYKVTIVPTHPLHYTPGNEGIQVSGVSSANEKFLTPIASTSDVEAPWGVAFTRRGEVVVTERGKDCVSIFNQAGKKILSFGSFGSDNGQFNLPLGVTVDGDGNVLVADSSNHRIQKFTVEGRFVAAVGTKGRGHLQFEHPRGIAFNSTNNKIYIVDGNHRVHVLNSDLTFSSIFGRKGKKAGQFFQPWDLAINGEGKVFITDSGNERIQIFTAEGRHTDTITWWDHYPLAITIGSQDELYVTDGRKRNHRSRLARFCEYKTLEKCYARVFTFPDTYEIHRLFFDIDYSCGLAMDESGVLCVCDSSENKIVFF